MAIPKICGIENEYGFIVLDKQGKQFIDVPDYDEAARLFVKVFLQNNPVFKYNQSKESPRKGILGEELPLHRPRGFFQELIHRLRASKLEAFDGFLPNGSRFYLDADHPEYSTPECLTPLDLVAHNKAGELVLMTAQDLFLNHSAKNDKYRILIHKNNSDGYGHSYGCHLNVLLSRQSVANRENFRYLVKKYIPFQIARIILTGGGKIGAENSRPSCRFQISQRADFLEQLVGVQTTERRPIFNTRDEPHADGRQYFRLHDISADALMCEQAIFLKAALTQIVLAMIEDKFLEEDWFPTRPLKALITVSRDLKFKTAFPLANGENITGLELLRRYLLKSKAYLNQNPMTDQHETAVNQARELLEQLEKDPRTTFGKLDWTTTWGIMESRPESAEGNILKFQEISAHGLYYKLLERGKIHRLLDDAAIIKAMVEPPTDTRAYLRSLIMKKFGNRIISMSWPLALLEIDNESRLIELKHPMLDKVSYARLLSELAPKTLE